MTVQGSVRRNLRHHRRLIAHEMGHAQRGEHLRRTGLHFVVLHARVAPCAGSRCRASTKTAQPPDGPAATALGPRSLRIPAWLWWRAWRGAVPRVALERRAAMVVAGVAGGAGWLVRPNALAPGCVAGLGVCHDLAATFWWLFISMHTYGGLAAPLASAAVLELAAFLGLRCCFGAFARLAPTHQALAILFLQRFGCWPSWRGTLWTGFPWGAGGYARVRAFECAGAHREVYGVGFGSGAGHAAGTGHTRDLRSLRAWALVAGARWCWGGAGLQRQCAGESCHTPARQPSAPISLALLQGNIPQNEKFEAGSGVADGLQWHADVLVAKASLVVAPETAIPLLPQQLMPGSGGAHGTIWPGRRRRCWASRWATSGGAMPIRCWA